MADGFIPLSQTIRYWPGFLGSPDFLDEVGLKKYNIVSTDETFSVNGDAIIFRAFEFDFLGIPGVSIAIQNQSGFTVIPFQAEITPAFRLTLSDLHFSFLFKAGILIPVENINNAWVKKVDSSGNQKPVTLTFGGAKIEFDLEKNIDIDLTSNP